VLQPTATSVLTTRRLYTFEAVGQLLGQEAVAAEEQHACLAALLRPLVSQLEAAVAPANGSGGGHGKAHEPAALAQQVLFLVSVIWTLVSHEFSWLEFRWRPGSLCAAGADC
jgi:hypothetical protein